MDHQQPCCVGHHRIARFAPLLGRSEVEKRVGCDPAAENGGDIPLPVENGGGDDDHHLPRCPGKDGLPDSRGLRIPCTLVIFPVAQLVDLSVEIMAVTFHVDDEIGLYLELRGVKG
ncbi:hypothetical protein SDC9_109313 [bioreactor metagenome]|uniref:Uncharacterized protein n=1 Tax=bioreactor metagenome TaxID=1076179 RepID=A0A645BCS3_9ZZZZ